jgi:CubicO group peptidase (beta-lactamase class C family)
MPRLHWDVSDLEFPGPTPLRGLLRSLGVRRLRLPSWLFDWHLLPHQARGDAGLKSTADDWCRLLQVLLADGALGGGAQGGGTRLLSASSVDELCRSVLPRGADLTPPYALGAAPASATPRFGVGDAGLGAVYDGTHRYANSFQGQGGALGLNVVLDAEAAGLHPAATGTCWWHGVGSTFFSFNRERNLGCVVLAQNYVAAKRLGALASVINAAHELDERGELSSSNG